MVLTPTLHLSPLPPALPRKFDDNILKVHRKRLSLVEATLHQPFPLSCGLLLYCCLWCGVCPADINLIPTSIDASLGQGSSKPSHRRTVSSPVVHDFLRDSMYSSSGPFGALGDSSNGLFSPRCGVGWGGGRLLFLSEYCAFSIYKSKFGSHLPAELYLNTKYLDGFHSSSCGLSGVLRYKRSRVQCVVVTLVRLVTGAHLRNISMILHQKLSKFLR